MSFYSNGHPIEKVGMRLGNICACLHMFGKGNGYGYRYCGLDMCVWIWVWGYWGYDTCVYMGMGIVTLYVFEHFYGYTGLDTYGRDTCGYGYGYCNFVVCVCVCINGYRDRNGYGYCDFYMCACTGMGME